MSKIKEIYDMCNNMRAKRKSGKTGNGCMSLNKIEKIKELMSMA